MSIATTEGADWKKLQAEHTQLSATDKHRPISREKQFCSDLKSNLLMLMMYFVPFKFTIRS